MKEGSFLMARNIQQKKIQAVLEYKNRIKEIKQIIIQEHLNSKDSLRDLSNKYNTHSSSSL